VGDPNPYLVLGVEPTASQEELKRAYRRLVRRYHPDRNPGDETAAERFREVRAAFELVGSAEARRAYDSSHASPFTSIGSPVAGSIFGDPERTPTRRRGASRGVDLETEVEISFAEAIFGTSAEIALERDEPCPDCQGRPDSAARCGRCEGEGLLAGESARICPACKGTGWASCGTCAGAGRLRGTRTHRVKVPPGVEDGTRIRIAGKGGPGFAGGEPGDLYVTTRVLPSRRYERRGRDLILTVPVSYAEAILGCEVDVPTPEGPIRVLVPSRCEQGRLLRVSGRGVPALGAPEERGDFYVRVQIVTEELSEEELDLVQMIVELHEREGRNLRRGLLAEASEELAPPSQRSA
jgi:molecular chaperone DnaJ